MLEEQDGERYWPTINEVNQKRLHRNVYIRGFKDGQEFEFKMGRLNSDKSITPFEAEKILMEYW